MKIFYLPDLGEGLAEAEIREWYVHENDEVKVDQPLASMETAKALVDVPSPYAGKIVALHGKVNEVIKTGAPLVSFETNETVENKTAKGSVVGALEESAKKWEEGEVIIGSPKTNSVAVRAQPQARSLAAQLGVNLSAVKSSSSHGLITVEDVKRFHQAEKSLLKGHATESLHGVRRAMAQAMAQSHREVVPVSIFEEADVTDLIKSGDITVAVINAIISAAKKEPALNAWFDGNSLERKLFSEVHLGLAIDTPEGLFVPVIKNAENISRVELRQIINEYKQSVRDRSIAANNLHGATITLSNFGTIAGRYATPIIVPPTVAILATGKIYDAPTVHAGQIVIGSMMPLSLTFDHRAVTGGEASRFLGEIVRFLQEGK